MATTTMLFSQEADTLVVHQNDTLSFDANISWIQRPCQDAQWQTSYKLKSPKDSTYYFIYNDQKQLIQEGLTKSLDSSNADQDVGFYHSKNYFYKRNGRLLRIYFQQNGRNVKTEYYKRGKLKDIKVVSDETFHNDHKM
jgi:hypothetical protein